MNELFPVCAGGLMGLACLRVRSIRTRFIIIAVLSVVFGFVATVISGEAAIGWEFLYADIPLVAGSSLAVLAASRACRNYGPMPRAMRDDP